MTEIKTVPSCIFHVTPKKHATLRFPFQKEFQSKLNKKNKANEFLTDFHKPIMEDLNQQSINNYSYQVL